MSCLDIWCTFVDFVSGIIDSRSSGSDVVKAKYREALTSLVTQILVKLQFRYNAPALEEMDDETIDDDVSELVFTLIHIEKGKNVTCG